MGGLIPYRRDTRERLRRKGFMSTPELRGLLTSVNSGADFLCHSLLICGSGLRPVYPGVEIRESILRQSCTSPF